MNPIAISDQQIKDVALLNEQPEAAVRTALAPVSSTATLDQAKKAADEKDLLIAKLLVGLAICLSSTASRKRAELNLSTFPTDPITGDSPE